MDRIDTVTRRTVLRVGAGLLAALGVGLLAACGSGGTAATGTAPATAASPVAGATPATGASSAPTTAPNAAPTSSLSATAQPGAAKPAPANAVTIWYGQDYIPEVTDTMKNQLDDFSKQKNVPVDYVVKSGSWGDQLNAAVQAGTAPDVWQSYDYQCQYWHAQDQALDVTAMVNGFKGQQGGFFDYVTATTSAQGKYYAVPLAVNAWPFHVRKDILDGVGATWPATWDDMRATGKKVTQAPKIYAFGWTMGKTNDANNHFIGALWTFGGKLQNDDGSFALKPKDDAAIATLQLAKDMYSTDKIIPPAVVQWDDGGNNTAYQDGQVAWTSNPTSVYTWLVKNKPDIAKATTFESYPKGPGGTFGQVDVWAVTIYKHSKHPDDAQNAMAWMLDSAHYKQRIEDLKGRFLPIYQAMLDDPMWQTPLYHAYTEIAKTGRIMAYSASPAKGYSDFTTRFLIGTMMQELIVKNSSPQEAYQNFYQQAQAVYQNYQ